MTYLYTIKNSRKETILEFELENQIKLKNEKKVVKKKLKEAGLFAKRIFVKSEEKN